MTELLLYLYAETPVHAGGIGGDGLVELPIQREAVTGYPVIWAQSLKGALRRAAREAQWDKDALRRVFGADITETASSRRADDGVAGAGALSVSDAHLVALPVPALRRTFAWVTSQVALARLARKYQALGLSTPPVPDPPAGAALAADSSWAEPPGQHALGPTVVPFIPGPHQALAAWAWRIADDAIGESPGSAPFAAKLRDDLLAVGSDVMPILSAECTEITARVHLGDTKAVENGPFYSEYLPAESIMAASITLRPRGGQPAPQDAARLARLLDGSLLQVGGDETLGKGLMWARLRTESR